MDQRTLDAFERLSTILDTLRRECPWDSKQTLDSLRYLTIEEVYELSEAILKVGRCLADNNKADAEKNDQGSKFNAQLRGELGDLFMHLMFYAKIAEDEGRFDLADVLNGISDKLVARHPFIYNKEAYEGENWEQIKMHEGRKSVLEGVPVSLPTLVKSIRMQQKAAGIGYRRPEHDQVPREEMTEEAFGDLLFGLVQWADAHGINADDALAKSNLRFAQEVKEYEGKQLGCSRMA